MRVLVISHIDGRLDHLELLFERLQTTPQSIGAIFVLGNLTAAVKRRQAYAEQQRSCGAYYGGTTTALAREQENDSAVYIQVFTLTEKLNVPVYLIPGEYDAPLDVLHHSLQIYHDTARIHWAHRKAIYFDDGYAVAGFGGQLTAGAIEDLLLLHFPNWEARVVFEHLASSDFIFQAARHRIFLFATPPHGKHIDRDNDIHVGSTTLNRVIQSYQPYIVCCAGPESGRGSEMLEGAHIVNPGALSAGSYALIDIDPFHLHLECLN